MRCFIEEVALRSSPDTIMYAIGKVDLNLITTFSMLTCPFTARSTGVIGPKLGHRVPCFSSI